MFPVWDKQTGEAKQVLADDSGREGYQRAMQHRAKYIRQRNIIAAAKEDGAEIVIGPHGSVVRITAEGEAWGRQQQVLKLEQEKDQGEEVEGEFTLRLG